MAEYRPTLFDKHGPGAVDRIRAFTYGIMVFGGSLGVLALAMGVHIATFAYALGAGVLTTALTLSLSKGAGDGWTAIAVSGASTPYEDQFSYQQSLVMQGKVEEALASFEEIIAASPNAVEPRLRAAELYSGRRDGARRAAELLREALKIPTIAPGRDIYATNRLVDLLVGPLRDPGRALVELRRLIDRYPTTTAAAHAREAIARLKTADG
jgi:hypothetical protein